MKKFIQITHWAILFFLLTGFTTDPNGKANAIYVNASKQMQSVKKETGSYTKAFERYQSARNKIHHLTTDFAAADIAVGLVSGQVKIAGIPLSVFEQLKSTLQALAEAEQDPLACALLVAETIEYDYRKVFLLSEIAGKYSLVGQHEKANKLLYQAQKLAITVKSEWLKAKLLSSISGQYAVAGQQEKSVEILMQALEAARTIRDAQDQSLVLFDIAGKYADIGQQLKADKILTQMFTTIGTIPSAGDKTSALIAIAGQYIDTGKQEKADQLISMILESTTAIEHASSKFISLSDIAIIYARIGQQRKAVQFLSKAFETVKANEDVFKNKEWALSRIASKYNEAGLYRKAVLMLSRALEESEISLSDRVLKLLSGAYVGMGRYPEALEKAESINSSLIKTSTLSDVAEKLYETGSRAIAMQILKKAFETAGTIEAVNYTVKAKELVKIAVIHAVNGQLSEAFRVAGTIEDAPSEKAKGLLKIADMYRQAGKQPDEKEKVELRGIVQTAVPNLPHQQIDILRKSTPSMVPAHTPEPPLWLRRISGQQIIPGSGLAGVKTGLNEIEVNTVLGGDSKKSEYGDHFKYRGISFNVYLSASHGGKSVRRFRLNDGNFNKSNHIPEVNGVSIGSTETELLEAFGHPLSTREHFTCPNELGSRGRAITYKYTGISFWVCEANKLVYLMDIP